jgi:hypothetical protein
LKAFHSPRIVTGSVEASGAKRITDSQDRCGGRLGGADEHPVQIKANTGASLRKGKGS